jgi:hypothetical protein
MQLLEIKEKAKTRYATFGTVPCPALNQPVIFNAKGFNHIAFRKNQDFRNVQEQIERYRLLDVVHEFIQFTNTYQEHEYVEKSDDKKSVEYWGLVAIFKGAKLKVILRKVGNGSIHFWSIIPAYTTSEKRDGKFKMKGDAATD